MLPSSQRLRAKEVVEVLKKGRGLRSGKYISAKVFLPKETFLKSGNATIRCSVVVSLKVARTNIARNRIRRVLYAAVQEILKNSSKKNQNPTHVVLFVRSIPENNIRNEFTADLIKILGLLGTSNE